MGGNGSTRWKDHQKARLVEGCHQLSAATFERALKHDQAGGILHWTDSREKVTDELSFSLSPVLANGTRYLVIEPGDNRRTQSVRLERAKLGWYSGWLFRCPTDCGRRVRKLFALPQWMVFTCRQCGGLTYKSTQTHDSRLDLARRDPVGFIQSRSRAPRTEKSRMVTSFLVLEASLPNRSGRGWGKKSTTSGSRAAAQMRQDFIDRWGFAPEDSGRVTNGG
jgi:hypothetical protein